MKLLAIDMDGTCLKGRGHLSGKTLGALRKAASAGIEIVPTTGRAVSCLPHRLKGEPFVHYIISSNGAVVTDARTNETIFQALMPFSEVYPLLEELSREELGITAHINREYVVQGRLLGCMGRLIYGKDAKNIQCVKDLPDFVREQQADIEELQLFFPSGARPRVAEILSNYGSVSAAYSNVYVEVFSKAASKGNALRALSEHLAVPKEEIACIGDGENDQSMFQASGLRFAMGNAVDTLKAQADYVLPTNRQNGVAAAIDLIDMPD